MKRIVRCWGRVRIVAVRLTNKLNLWHDVLSELVTHKVLPLPLLSSSTLPPASGHHDHYVHNIHPNKPLSLPFFNLAIPEND